VELEIGATAGISVAPSHGKDPGELQQRAAVALAAAKRAGLAWELWTPPLQRASSSELVLQSELRHAIKDGQLRLLYQPVVAARTGEVAGVEALVRWQHPQHGLLAPSAFLAQAERSPLIVELTAWVLEEAVRQGAAWEAAGQRLPMSVNLSARLLVHDGLPDLVAGVLARHQLPAHLLTLEITETAVMANAERAMALLATLRQLGTRTSLDDFGTGFSSLSLLADLALDELKVDRRFVAGSQHGWKDAAIVATLVELGHRLGLHVVAEGVEDEATRVKLAELDYDLLQGYLFARPLTADAVQPFRAAALRAAARQSPVGTASPRH